MVRRSDIGRIVCSHLYCCYFINIHNLKRNKMKNQIVVKEKVTIVSNWDKVRVYLNKLHENVSMITLKALWKSTLYWSPCGCTLKKYIIKNVVSFLELAYNEFIFYYPEHAGLHTEEGRELFNIWVFPDTEGDRMDMFILIKSICKN